jgi:hypothetical protein
VATIDLDRDLLHLFLRLVAGDERVGGKGKLYKLLEMVVIILAADITPVFMDLFNNKLDI